MKKTVKIMVRIHVEQPLSNHRFPSEKPDGQGLTPPHCGWPAADRELYRCVRRRNYVKAHYGGLCLVEDVIPEELADRLRGSAMPSGAGYVAAYYLSLRPDEQAQVRIQFNLLLLPLALSYQTIDTTRKLKVRRHMTIPRGLFEQNSRGRPDG